MRETNEKRTRGTRVLFVTLTFVKKYIEYSRAATFARRCTRVRTERAVRPSPPTSQAPVVESF